MPSLADIPDEFLSKRGKAEFILWNADLPIEPTHRRELANIWSEATNLQFDAIDWTFMTKENRPATDA